MTANVRPIAQVVYRNRDLQQKASAQLKFNESPAVMYGRMILTGMADGYTLAIRDICQYLEGSGYKGAARELERAAVLAEANREKEG